MTETLRRTRQPHSLGTVVAELLDDLQCPVSTAAIRIILTDRGRPTTAEQLGRLAAYQREDFQRSRIPPELCSALLADGSATKPRWWARGSWRLERRILTEDARPLSLAHLAAWLCSDLAERPARRHPALITQTLGTIATVLGRGYFEVPQTSAEWRGLRADVYAQYRGSFSNLTGPTGQQHDAEIALQAQGLSPYELLFGRGLQ